MCIGLVSFCCFLVLVIIDLILKIITLFILVKKLRRTIATYIASAIGRLMLYFLGVFNINYKHRKISNRNPDVILSSQSSIIDWVYLYYSYAPKFLWIVKSDDSKSVTKFR